MQIAQVTGTAVELAGQSIILKDGTRLSYETALQWPEDERNKVGLYGVAYPEPQEGKRLVGMAMTYKKGQGVTLTPAYEDEDRRPAAAKELDTIRLQFVDAQIAGAPLPEGFDAYAEALGQIAKADEPYTDPLPEKPASRA